MAFLGVLSTGKRTWRATFSAEGAERCVQGVVLRPAPGQCRDRCRESGFYAKEQPGKWSVEDGFCLWKMQRMK
ncbi:hypothetical protein CapIbe_007501 [Capra ibex]